MIKLGYASLFSTLLVDSIEQGKYQLYLSKCCTVKVLSAHNTAADVCALMELYQKAPSTERGNDSYYFTVASVKQSIAVIENKKNICLVTNSSLMTKQ